VAEPASGDDSTELKKAKIDGGLPTIVESEAVVGQASDDGPANEESSSEDRPQRNRRQPGRFPSRVFCFST